MFVRLSSTVDAGKWLPSLGYMYRIHVVDFVRRSELMSMMLDCMYDRLKFLLIGVPF